MIHRRRISEEIITSTVVHITEDSRQSRSLPDFRLTARFLPFLPAAALPKYLRSPAALRFCRLASGKNHQKFPQSLKVRQTSSGHFRPMINSPEFSVLSTLPRAPGRDGVEEVFRFLPETEVDSAPTGRPGLLLSDKNRFVESEKV